MDLFAHVTVNDGETYDKFVERLAQIACSNSKVIQALTNVVQSAKRNNKAAGCFSPSAEVRGHGPGQEKLQKGKEDVRLDKIEPVGNYAIKLVFDDGHDSGLYSWEYLHELCKDYKENWHDYLDRLNKSGYARKKP